MIALAIVLHRELPVALHHDIDLLGDLGVGEIMRCQIGLDRRPHIIDVLGRILSEAEEEDARDVSQMRGLEAEAVAFDFRRHMFGEAERAFEVIGPVVILADDFRDRTLFDIHDPRAAMPADIVEGAPRRPRRAR